jgi:exonuclease VII small subunit
MKKSESDSESVYEMVAEATMVEIRRLERRIMDLEAAVEAMERGDNTGLKHQNDGGWFD